MLARVSPDVRFYSLMRDDRFQVILRGSKDKPKERKKNQAKYSSIVYFFRLDVHRASFRGLLVISPTVREDKTRLKLQTLKMSLVC